MPIITQTFNQTLETRNELISNKNWVSTKSLIGFTIIDVSKPASIKRAIPIPRWDGLTARTIWSKKRVAGSNSTISPTLQTHSFFHVDAADYANYIVRPTGLKNKLALRIKDQVSNLPVTILELGKTTDMVFNLVRDVQNHFHRLRNGRILNEFVRDLINPHDRPSRQIAKRWLELQYGWKPTLIDIHGLSIALSKKVKEDWIYAKVSKADSRVVETSNSSYRILQIRAVSEERLVARYRVKSGGAKPFAQTGLTNPALAVWELVPYSFVFDYLLGVGDWLSCFDALYGVESLSFYSGTKSTVEVNALGPLGYSPQTFAKAQYVEKVRGNLETSLPIEFPSISVNDSMTRLINSLALLRNLRK